MDGRGRWLDNVFVERLWRSVKYEEIYLWRHETVPALRLGLERYFDYYNVERRHQSLENRTPVAVYGPARDAPTNVCCKFRWKPAVATWPRFSCIAICFGNASR